MKIRFPWKGGAPAALLALVFLAVLAPAAEDNSYMVHNLVSDTAGTADLTDPNLVNAWGLTASATSPWWVADNGTAFSTLYNGTTGAKLALTVSVPGAPTGTVFNGGATFVISNGTLHAPARFLFASEDGTISGWNPAVTPPTQAVVVVDRSSAGAVYKGLAITSTPADFLYAVDFHNARVDVFDGNFSLVTSAGSFVDSQLPDGYAPFGIQNISGRIFVSYAKQDADAHDEVPGQGRGFVDAYDTSGNLLARVAQHGQLNAPWGLALAPMNFGRFSGDLLVGNFGDGQINAYEELPNGQFEHRGELRDADGKSLTIDGLWALQFGHGAFNNGATNILFFTAGPDDETHGLFGSITAN